MSGIVLNPLKKQDCLGHLFVFTFTFDIVLVTMSRDFSDTSYLRHLYVKAKYEIVDNKEREVYDNLILDRGRDQRRSVEGTL